MANLRRQIDVRWPDLGQRLASFMRVSREKLDDIYSSAARAISEHREAFEDRLAERKAEARAATRDTHQQSVAARRVPRKARGAVKSPGVGPAEKKPTRSPTKPLS